jgi:DNA polymerase-3 subunit delta'
MDQSVSNNSLSSPVILTHPAYLFVGDTDSLLAHTITLLQKQFCASSGCSVCIQCRKLREQQHESVLWLAPEKQYALDDLKVIFSTISFALDTHQQFYFILQQADHLTSACANALLKSLEEPPTGYHFILLAQRSEALLPTIKSRCLITNVGHAYVAPTAALIPFFTTTQFQDPLAFAKELDNTNPNEWQSVELLDQLFVHWSHLYKKAVIGNDAQKIKVSERMMQHIKKAMAQPPMPGSNKLFWKNLFLQIKEL